MNQIMQNELDIVEEYILKKLFLNINDPIIGPKANMLMTVLKRDLRNDINTMLNTFEKVAGGFLTEDGKLDGEIVSGLLNNRFPFLNGLKIPDMKLIDIVKMIDEIINFDNLGYKLRNF